MQTDGRVCIHLVCNKHQRPATCTCIKDVQTEVESSIPCFIVQRVQLQLLEKHLKPLHLVLKTLVESRLK